MLTENQKAVLDYIVKNNPEAIIEMAEENSLDPDASIGVAHFLLANPNNFERMSGSQNHHFKENIKPLITNVLCEGTIGTHEDGSSSCIGNNFIGDGDLLGAYIGHDMRCPDCIAEKERWYANNP